MKKNFFFEGAIFLCLAIKQLYLLILRFITKNNVYFYRFSFFYKKKEITFATRICTIYNLRYHACINI